MSNNLSLSPQLINNLSQAILQRFSAGHQSSNSSPSPQNDLVSTLVNSLQQSLISSFSPPPSQISIDNDDGAAVSRTPSASSISSMSSMSSVSSLESRHEWAGNDEDDDSFFGRKKKRKSPSDSQKFDSEAVIEPVLEKFDAEYLALHPDVENQMFRRRFARKKKWRQHETLEKKQRNRDAFLQT